MVTNEIRRMRCGDSLAKLTDGGNAVFFTLTTPDSCDYHSIRDRWRALRHDLLRSLRRKHSSVYYVMNYELHPGYLVKVVADDRGDRVLHSDGNPHGWHIHGVISCFVPIREFRSMLDRHGFGRVDVRRVTTKGVADYLTKHALKAYRGLSRRERDIYKGCRLRLVNCSRGLPCLSDYRWSSDFIRSVASVVSLHRHRLKDGSFNVRDCRLLHSRASVAVDLGLSDVRDYTHWLFVLQTKGSSAAAFWLSRRKFLNLLR